MLDATPVDDVLGIEQDALPEPPPPEPGDPILWHSNAPWCGSGYGTQSGLFGPRLQRDLGYDVAFSAFHGLKGKRLGWYSQVGTPHQVYPAAKDPHGNDVLGSHAAHFFQGRPGMVILLSDVWVVRHQLAAMLPMVAWCPVDHSPCIPDTVEWFEKGGAIPVAMSQFGRDELTIAGIEDVEYAPHGFDPAIFQPTDRGAARATLNLPQDAFIVGMVANNLGYPSRKCFAQAFQAFARFKGNHPDAVLYLHTLLEVPRGENLLTMANTLKIKPLSVDQYALALGAPDSLVSATLNAFDVLLNPSAGEGFGVPLIEAQACGTPCIVTDFSSMPEVAPVRVGNWAVGGQESWTHFDSWQMTPSIDAIVAALELAYAEGNEERLARRVAVHSHAQNYVADKIVAENWKPILERARETFIWRKKQARRFS